MSDSTDPQPATTDTNNTEQLPPRRYFSQRLGAFVVVAGVVLVALSSAGMVEFDDSTARLFLLFGSILVLGREATGYFT